VLSFAVKDGQTDSTGTDRQSPRLRALQTILATGSFLTQQSTRAFCPTPSTGALSAPATRKFTFFREISGFFLLFAYGSRRDEKLPRCRVGAGGDMPSS
jgi:hypothetical protein